MCARIVSHSQTQALGALLLREADALAREKCLAPQIVFECLEAAFQRIAKETYGQNHDIRASIDRHTGAVTIGRHMQVVQEVEDPNRQVSVDTMPESVVGEELVDDLPVPSFNRVTIQAFKGTLSKSLWDIERSLQYDEFKDKVGHIISGLVKRLENGNVIVDIGRAEGIIPRSELIPRETYRVGDRIKCYIYQVKQETKGPQIFLSRSHPGFLAKLFAQEVPQIYDGLIEIKAVARDPGSRAKVAISVVRDERGFDPVGACVGVKGTRVNAVSQELHGEKIDVILWSPDLPVFAVNALTPAEVIKVVVEKPDHLKVIVPDHQQSIAIGRRGQNARLASQITGTQIEIATETKEREDVARMRQEVTKLFMEKLDIEEIMAYLLVCEGFESIQDLASASIHELGSIQGMGQELAEAVKERAEEALEKQKEEQKEAFLQAGGEKEMLTLGLPPAIYPCLMANKVLSVKDLADLSLDELLDMLGDLKDLHTSEEWGQLILKART